MSDDEYEIPLQDQRVFGAGIKRKRVKFVPSTSSTPATTAPPSQSASDLYLSIVMSKSVKNTAGSTSLQEVSFTEQVESPTQGLTDSDICDICKLPLSSLDNMTVIESEDPDSSKPRPRPHEASIAHQVCLAHSHPPSHLDRNRKGLAILSSQGWDPDSRQGLGATGQGIQFPIKAKPKNDKIGIGVVLPKDIERMKKPKLEKLDAGKVRKIYEKDKRKETRLREMFYQSDEVERYLGGR